MRRKQGRVGVRQKGSGRGQKEKRDMGKEKGRELEEENGKGRGRRGKGIRKEIGDWERQGIKK